ncbi:MAG: hypothetical protein ACLTJ5_05140 [Clostridium sp.]
MELGTHGRRCWIQVIIQKYTAKYEKEHGLSRLFNTASNEIKSTSIAAATGNYYRLGDIVIYEAMILTTSSYACHHISGLPYEPDHSRPSNVYPIGVVSSGNGTNSPFNLISGSGSYYVQNGAYASGKHIAIGMYTVGIERLNEEVLKWKLTKKKR